MIGSPAVYAIRARNTLERRRSIGRSGSGHTGPFRAPGPGTCERSRHGFGTACKRQHRAAHPMGDDDHRPVFGDGVQKSKIPTRLEFVRGSFTYVSN